MYTRRRQQRSGQKERGTTMRIERRNTTEGQSPYTGIDFRLTTSEIRNPDGSVVFRLENVEVPEFWSQVASDVLAQKYFRKAGVAARLKKVEEETVPSWLWRSVPDTEALATLPENERYVSELSAMVQHRAALGLRRRWPRPGPLLRRLEDRQTHQIQIGLRASAAARLLHPGHRGRPRQRGRHHGSVGTRGAPVQIRLRHRLEFLAAARRRRKTFRRRSLLRPDEFLEDR